MKLKMVCELWLSMQMDLAGSGILNQMISAQLRVEEDLEVETRRRNKHGVG
jgi:hypothetical protein